jgi:hypothetical protein
MSAYIVSLAIICSLLSGIRNDYAAEKGGRLREEDFSISGIRTFPALGGFSYVDVAFLA